jgi:CubicO group peptidase (beta-lactamase class C family)
VIVAAMVTFVDFPLTASVNFFFSVLLNVRLKHLETLYSTDGMRYLILTLFTILLFIMFTFAQKKKYPDAAESRPSITGYMSGFPPKGDKVISARDGSFFEFPALRYSVAHMREFMPTINVPRGNVVPVAHFEYDLDACIDSVTFLPTGRERRVTWRESLDLNYTDGIIVLHKGKVVYEKYFGDYGAEMPHAVMSVTKSFTGLLAAMLFAEGRLDTVKLVRDYVPELSSSGFGDATIRELMDMTTAIKYSEDYTDPAAEVWAFSAAGNPMISHDNGVNGFYDYLVGVKKDGEHGNVFGYRTVNADALGWVISRITGKSVAQLLTELIWHRMGMEQDAYYQVDALGVPFAGGGLNATLRDLARFAEMLRMGGEWRGVRIVPAAAINDIVHGGNRQAFAASEQGKSLKGWSYRDMWWITNNSHRAYMARGVHGQAIYIDPVAEMTIVRLASTYLSSNMLIDPLSLPAYAAVAEYLLGK